MFNYEKHNSTKIGTWGWVGLAAYVVAWDLVASETLTHAAHRAVETPLGRAAVTATVGYMGLHLLHHIHDSVDPLVVIPKKIGEYLGSNTTN